jgi:phosphoglycerate dehydrogenase-like enzyme
MQTVNILVIAPIGEECLKQITAISPRVKVYDVFELSRADYRGDPAAQEQFDALLADAEVIFAFRLPRDVLARAPKLKWIQVMSAGVDRFLAGELRQSSVMLTNVSGIHATPIAEFVISFMLMFVKQAPLYFDLKQKKRWQRVTPAVLRSKTVGIVGLGSIGREVARLSKAFGMRVIATRRSAKSGMRARNVDLMLPREQLPQLLSDSDFVAITLPLTPETEKLIGEAELRAMKPTAYLINIGRGRIIDEEALIRALSEGWIAGAGLDVFATEPLPTESKLWELPNVILSHHVSGGMEDYNVEATELFCENLKRYLEGKRLLTLVGKKRGY